MSEIKSPSPKVLPSPLDPNPGVSAELHPDIQTSWVCLTGKLPSSQGHHTRDGERPGPSARGASFSWTTTQQDRGQQDLARSFTELIALDMQPTGWQAAHTSTQSSSVSE